MVVSSVSVLLKFHDRQRASTFQERAHSGRGGGGGSGPSMQCVLRVPPLRLGSSSRLVARSASSLASAVSRVLDAARARLVPRSSNRPWPSLTPEDVHRAVADTAAEKNGYQAWALYTALRQGGVTITPADVSQLAGALLHVDHELHADLAARRTLSLLESERQAGREPSRELLQHGAAACALRGLPQLALALCEESEAEARRTSLLEGKRHAGAKLDLPIRAAFIRACGVAGELPRAFEAYRDLEHTIGRRPPTPPLAAAMLEACVSAGELGRAFTMLDELLGHRFRPNSSALVPLLRGCAQAADEVRARQLLKKASELRVPVSHGAVREFARVGHLEGCGGLLQMALELHRNELMRGQRMPIASTTKLMRACLRAGREADAADVLAIATRHHGAARGTLLAEEAMAVRNAGGKTAAGSRASLDSSLDLLHSLTRQEWQHEQAAQSHVLSASSRGMPTSRRED